MSEETLTILTNAEVIAINQDPLGVQAMKVASLPAIPPSNSTEINVTTADAEAYPCTETKEQKWIFNKTDLTIRNLATGLCLEIPACQNSSGVQLDLWPCHVGEKNFECNSTNQQWQMWPNGTITSVMNPHMCMDLEDSTGPTVQIWSCNGGSNQVWKYSPTTYSLTVEDLCLDMNYGNLEVYAGPLSGGAYTVVLFNRGYNPQTITANWDDIGLETWRKATVRDLWQHKDLGTFQNNFTAMVESHGVVHLKVTPL